LRDNKEGDENEEGIDIEEEEEYICATIYVWYGFVSMWLYRMYMYMYMIALT
jgi:hypothetical protein